MLHILEVPKNLRRPQNKELERMEAFFDREVARVHYMRQRMDFRGTEKMEKGVSPLPVTRTIRLHVFEAAAALSR